MASRQREYQKRHEASGRCIQCPSPSLARKTRCFRHQLFYQLRKYGLYKGFLAERASKQRERLAAHLLGRYHAVLGGFLDPGDAAQRLKDSSEIRLRLRIKTGGVRGVKKMAAVLRSMDRHALREKKGEAHAAV